MTFLSIPWSYKFCEKQKRWGTTIKSWVQGDRDVCGQLLSVELPRSQYRASEVLGRWPAARNEGMAPKSSHVNTGWESKTWRPTRKWGWMTCELWSVSYIWIFDATFQTKLFPGERWSSHVIWVLFLKHERGTPLFFRCNCFRRFFRIVSSIQASRVRVSGPTQHRKLTSWYLFWVNIIDYQLGEFTCRSLLALPLITIFNPTFRFW